jgi:hypothetical protein
MRHIERGDTVRIVLAVTVGEDLMTLQVVSGQVLQAMPKSLRITFSTRCARLVSIWVPRRAFTDVRRDGQFVHAKLARWSAEQLARSCGLTGERATTRRRKE